MTTVTKNFLTAKLFDAMNSPEHESVMARCNQMYAALFNCSDAPVRAGDLDRGDLRQSGFTFNASDLETPSHSDWVNAHDDDGECDLSVARYESWLVQSFKVKVLITPDTLLVDACNYKGEGEGYALYEAMRNKPVFRSKSDSFSTFNV